MSIVSGTAATMTDLVSAISAFVVAEGWTSRRSSALILEFDRTVTRDGGPIVGGFSLAAADGTDVLGGGTGTYLSLVPWVVWNAGATWSTQPDRPVASSGGWTLGCSAPTAALNIPYTLFSSATGEQLVLVVGRTTGVFNYIALGFLDPADKFGVWPGWQYCAGARGVRENDGRVVDVGFGVHHAINIPPIPPGYTRATFAQPTMCFRVDSDGSGLEWRSGSTPNLDASYRTARVVSGWISESSGTRNTNIPGIGGLPSLLHIWPRSRSMLAQNVVVFPCVISAHRAATVRWSPLCRLPLLYTAFTSGALNEGAQFLIGADTYRAYNSYAVHEIP